MDGIPGIMFAYSQALRNITLAGPTLFAPVINLAASIASQHVSQDNQKYFVLLIITVCISFFLPPAIFLWLLLIL